MSSPDMAPVIVCNTSVAVSSLLSAAAWLTSYAFGYETTKPNHETTKPRNLETSKPRKRILWYPFCFRVFVLSCFRAFVFSWFRGFVVSCLRVFAVFVVRPRLLPQHRVSLRLELVPRLPLRHPVRLRDAIAYREQHLQVLRRAGQIPIRQHDVGRLVIPLLVPLGPHLLGVLRRLADVVDP